MSRDVSNAHKAYIVEPPDKAELHGGRVQIEFGYWLNQWGGWIADMWMLWNKDSYMVYSWSNTSDRDQQYFADILTAIQNCNTLSPVKFCQMLEQHGYVDESPAVNSDRIYADTVQGRMSQPRQGNRI